MAKNLLEGKLNKDKVQKPELTPEQIEAMHQAITAPVSTEMIEESPLGKVKKANNNEKIAKKSPDTALPQVSEAITRLSIDVTKEMHKLMKMRVIETEQSIRDYVVSLIRKDLGIK